MEGRLSEIECPSCGARYRVPASAIGPGGRRVQCAKCGETWFAQPIEEEAPAEVDAEVADAGAQEQAALPAPDHGDSAESPAERAAARAAAVADDDADRPAATDVDASTETAAQDHDAADAGTDAGADVTNLPQQQPRRRRRWRDLREDSGEGDQAFGDAPDNADPGADKGGGADPFAERLARLRQASLAPDPMPRAAQEQTLRRRRGDDDGDRAAGDRAAAAQYDDPHEAPPYDEAPGSDGTMIGADAARAQLEAEEAAAPAGGEAGGEQRNEQMAEIRRMLDEMKVPGSEGSGSAEAERAFARERDVAGIEKMAPAPIVERRRDEYSDPLREKLLDPQVKAKRQGADGERQRAGLMRKHQKRNRRRQMAEKTRRSRGGFYTGLFLVLGAIGMLAAVYAYADVIKQKLPGTSAAIDDYVASVDRGRADLDERLVALERRVDEIIKVMSE